MFDVEPDDPNPHGQCAAEIHRLETRVTELEAERDHYRLALDHLRVAIKDHGTRSGTLMVNPGHGHSIVTADDFITNSLETYE